MSRDTAILAALLRPLCGVCRICRCHGDECSLATGEKCFWTDDLRTLCSNPRCVIAADLGRKRYQGSARKRRTGKSKGRAA